MAWHFLPPDRKFRYGDGNIAEAGYTYTVEPPLHPCHWGLHFCVRALDGLLYAPGSIIGRVEISGKVIRQKDKGCATERTYLWIAEAAEILWDARNWAGDERTSSAYAHAEAPITSHRYAPSYARDYTRAYARAYSYPGTNSYDAIRTTQNAELERRLLALHPNQRTTS